MRKALLLAAMICIVVGLVGMIVTGNFGDFGKPGKDYAYEWKFTNEELKHLQIESSYNLELTVVESTDGQNTISVEGTAPESVIQSVQQTTIKDQTLALLLKAEKNRFFHFLDFNRSQHRITIALTDTAKLESVTTRMSASNLRASNLQAQSIELRTSSGNITVEDMDAADLKISSTSGNINGERLQGNIDASASSGNVKLLDTNGDAMKVKVSSGLVHITAQSIKTMDVHASSGNVTIQLPSDFEGVYDLSASSGSIRAPESKGLTNDSVKVQTTSGNIRITQK